MGQPSDRGTPHGGGDHRGGQRPRPQHKNWIERFRDGCSDKEKQLLEAARLVNKYMPDLIEAARHLSEPGEVPIATTAVRDMVGVQFTALSELLEQIFSDERWEKDAPEEAVAD